MKPRESQAQILQHVEHVVEDLGRGRGVGKDEVDAAPHSGRERRIGAGAEGQHGGEIIDEFQLWTQAADGGDAGLLSRCCGLDGCQGADEVLEGLDALDGVQIFWSFQVRPGSAPRRGSTPG